MVTNPQHNIAMCHARRLLCFASLLASSSAFSSPYYLDQAGTLFQTSVFGQSTPIGMTGLPSCQNLGNYRGTLYTVTPAGDLYSINPVNAVPSLLRHLTFTGADRVAAMTFLPNGHAYIVLDGVAGNDECWMLNLQSGEATKTTDVGRRQITGAALLINGMLNMWDADPAPSGGLVEVHPRFGYIFDWNAQFGGERDIRDLVTEGSETYAVGDNFYAIDGITRRPLKRGDTLAMPAAAMASTTEYIMPSTVSVLSGEYLQGTIDSFAVDDADRFVLQPEAKIRVQAIPLMVELVFEVPAGLEAPSAIGIQYRTSVQSTYTATWQAYNFTTGRWDSRKFDFTSQGLLWSSFGSLDRHTMSPDRKVRIRLGLSRPDGSLDWTGAWETCWVGASPS